MELIYGINPEGRLVHVSSVPNGLLCHCTCPHCHAPLVAKNNGETISPHFAHASGLSCSGAHESELHLLAKNIIQEEKALMLPPYGTVYGGGMVHFDEVEVEKRNDINSLQPDLCGVVRDKKTNIAKRLWVEIMVTHAIGPEKRELIRKNGISCIEINMSRFMSMQVTREDIVKFLLTDVSSREWTNNPLLEEKRQKQMECARAYNDVRHKMKQSYPDDEVAYDIDIRMKQREYLMQHPDECIVNTQYCRKCKYHSTRQRILEEVKRRHLPSWVSEALEGDLLYWTYDNISFTVNYHQCYRVEYDGYFRLLPTSSPDVHGMIVSEREIKQNNLVISFLTDTVPGLIALEGMTCREVKKWLDRTRKENKQYLVCGKAEVVKRKRRRNK